MSQAHAQAQAQEQAQENNNHICSICYDLFQETNPSTSLECNHTFHPKCIIDWFRQGNESCPLCRQGEETTHLYPAHFFPCPNKYKCYVASDNWKRYRFKIMRTLTKSKKCPPPLKTAFANYKTQKEKYLDLKRQRKAFWKSNDYRFYMKIRRLIMTMRNKVYRQKRKLDLAYETVCGMPYTPVKVPLNDALYAEVLKSSTLTLKKKKKHQNPTHTMVLRSRSTSS